MKTTLLNSFIGLTLALGPASTHAAIGTITGPTTHKNLQIFLVHGDAQLEGRHYLTLSEALEQGIVVVRETGNVQELSIENVSRKATVFLNAGDIVKGGRQDRTVRDDLVLPPLSGRAPLTAFCVEHGRWSKRGNEDAAAFSANTKVLSSRKEKLAARYGSSQSEVWSGVADQQARLNENVSRLTGKNVDTRNASSASSLQLTLEDKDLEAVRKHYLEKLNPVLDGKTDVIGFVYAINGELNSAEVYNNTTLFRALWPKLLDAAVTEAITECRTDRQYPVVQSAELRSFFENALAGSATERAVWKSTRIVTRTTATTVVFEAVDLEADGVWLHKSFINKGPETVTVPLDQQPVQQRRW